MVQWGMRWAVVATAIMSTGLAMPVAHADEWATVGNGLADTSRPDVSMRGSITTIVWATPGGELRTRGVSAKGRLRSPRLLQRGWNYLSADPVRVGSGYVAAGTRSLPGSPSYWPGAAFVTDGTSLRSLGDDRAYLSQGQDAVLFDGRLLYAYTDGGATVQVSAPDGAPAQITRGTALEPAIAADGGTAHVGWFSAGEGVLVSGIASQPGTTTIAAPSLAPGSLYTVPTQRIPLAVRKGDAWTAYQSGAKRIRVWRAGQGSAIEISTPKRVVAVDLAVAGSRLWLAYATTNQVCVQRTAAGGSTFGATSCRAGAASAVSLAAGKWADVVATVAPKALYARFLPALTVTARPRAGTIVVRDAGVPVAKARVTVGRQKTRSNAKGKARLQAWPSKQLVTVRVPGYEQWKSR
ncbi:MAG: hypothetical protein H6528_04020 [Actinobacteria bacterium]|nr:hypothetical protein [Actinomycetota bacterium]MCB8996448.1 hypothetical protein [Actinomycetota bacterium]